MYLLDTNVLIEAKNRYYAFDLAPGFWAWIGEAHRQGVTCSIKHVSDLSNLRLTHWSCNRNRSTADTGTEQLALIG